MMLLNAWCKVDVFQLVTEDLVQIMSLDPQIENVAKKKKKKEIKKMLHV
jgi:hypothetical protein